MSRAGESLSVGLAIRKASTQRIKTTGHICLPCLEKSKFAGNKLIQKPLIEIETLRLSAHSLSAKTELASRAFELDVPR